jgi:hypothetical protein
MPAIRPLLALACGGAAGVIKPTSQRFTYISASALALIFAEITDGLSLITLTAFLAGQTYDLFGICASGDPGDPGMSAQDWADAVDFGNPVVNLPARTKAGQWLIHYMWPNWCDCADGTVPPANTVTQPPAGSANQGTPPAGAGANCWDNTVTEPPTLAQGQAYDLSKAQPQLPASYAGGPYVFHLPTPTPASVELFVTPNQEGSNAEGVNVFVNWFNANGTSVQPGFQFSALTPGETTDSGLIPVPTTAVNWDFAVTNVSGGGVASTNTCTLRLVIYCAGESPTTINSPCCPPDPSVDARLSAIIDMLTALLSEQSLQGAYQDTVRHAGLSGSGTIAINAATSAIRVEVKSDLTSWPSTAQVPTYYYSLGFITPSSSGIPSKGTRLVYATQIYSYLLYVDHIDYALAAPVVIDVVELTQGA